MNIRCDLCGLYGCRHNNPRLPGKPAKSTPITPGEDIVDDFSGVVDVRKPISTIPMGPLPLPEDQKRVLIPPPPAVPNISGAPVNKSLQTIDMKKDWVNCNICKGKVFIPYLDQHLKVHTHNFEPNTIPTTTTSTSIVRVPVVTGTSSSTTSSSSSSTSTSSSPAKPSLNKQEIYKFRPLEQVCFASSVSQDARFSDFTIILWEKERTSVQTTNYVGGSTSYTTKEWERFSIHMVYDSLEDYYTLSCKLLKRSGYSNWDTEDTIPDRICFQNELFGEIKRALLFFRISPKVAYMHFRRLMRGEFVIERDNNGRAFICQTKNCETLSDRLKKSNNTGGQAYEHCGWHD